VASTHVCPGSECRSKSEAKARICRDALGTAGPVFQIGIDSRVIAPVARPRPWAGIAASLSGRRLTALRRTPPPVRADRVRPPPCGASSHGELSAGTLGPSMAGQRSCRKVARSRYRRSGRTAPGRRTKPRAEPYGSGGGLGNVNLAEPGTWLRVHSECRAPPLQEAPPSITPVWPSWASDSRSHWEHS
jgi:hypothetical protein